MIYTHTTPTPNAYRRAYWYMQRAAFPDSTAAPRLIPMAGPVNKFDLRGGGVERVGSFPVAQTRSMGGNPTRPTTDKNRSAVARGYASPKLGESPSSIAQSRVSVRPASPLFATLKANQQRLSTALSTLANLFGWVVLLALASWPLWI